MIKIDLNVFQEDLRRLGLIMLAAGLIGRFIVPVSPGLRFDAAGKNMTSEMWYHLALSLTISVPFALMLFVPHIEDDQYYASGGDDGDDDNNAPKNFARPGHAQ